MLWPAGEDRLISGVSGSLSSPKEMAWSLGGKVGKCDHREYGFAEVQVVKAETNQSLADKLFQGFEDSFQVQTNTNVPLPSRRLTVTAGLDVSWRSTRRNPARIPDHWSNGIRTVCGHSAQVEALLWHSVSS